MKLVIQTQYCENYAAHNEDYVHGVSESYWKNKGGSTYIVDYVSIEQAQSEGYYEELYSHIEFSNEACEEYVISAEVIDDIDFDITNHVEKWETPIMLRNFSGTKFHATKTTMNGEYGYMKSNIQKTERTWVLGDDNSYAYHIHLTDGRVMTESEFKEAA